MPTVRLGRFAAIACALTFAFAAAPALGKDDGTWGVKGKIFGKVDKDTGKVKASKNVSGITCTKPKGFPRSCLVIDDDLQKAQFVKLKDGKLVASEDTIKLIDNKFENESISLDGEGVAFSKGFYHVIGSHGRPRKEEGKSPALIDASIVASSQIVRFRAEDGTDAKVERTSKLRDIIAGEKAFDEFRKLPINDNGITIEGIAIQDDTNLLAGFRGPVVDGESKAIVLSAPIDALFDGGAASHKLFRLPLGKGRGVRDLAAFKGGVLILAGPMANKAGVYAIYAWDGKSETVKLLSELTQFDPERKPEALLPLETGGKKMHVLVIFDGDKNGAPTEVEIPAPPKD